MFQLIVSDMTCGHCAGTITKALKGVDPQARVEISLADKRVRVQTRLSREEVLQEISEAGYTPRLESEASAARAQL